MTPAADLERRFGGLRRLYGDAGYAALRAASVAVVGLGGVGSWTVEALARSGVARLVLVDLDHVAESNVNRQVQALGSTLGQHKGLALRERIADIHPACEVIVIDAFAGPDNWPTLLTAEVNGIVDACDQVAAKAAIAAWALVERKALVCVGAAGGKTRAQLVEVADLAETTHDPLLAALRQRLRQQGAVPRQRAAPKKGGAGAAPKTGVRCVFSRETPRAPSDAAADCALDGSLNCHGYGSSVAVTATFGFVAAGALVEALLAPQPASRQAAPEAAEIQL